MIIQVNLLSSEIRENLGFKFEIDNRAQTPYVRRAKNWVDMVKSVKNDDVELVLWKRSLTVIRPAKVKSESKFELLLGEQQDILTGFDDMFDATAWPESLRELVQQDVKQCLNAFEQVLSESHYRVRLQAISNDACRKLHQDTTFQRLIITYRGDGTVWHDVNSNTDQQAIEMECVLLRGKRADRIPQILHRSPVFRAGQIPRLIMAIDVIPSIN